MMLGNPNPPLIRERKIVLPDRQLVLPKRFDHVTKRRIRRDPQGFLANILGIETEASEIIETEQLSMKTHLADSFILVTIGGKQAIVHCEFQTHDSRDVPMPFRMAGYIGTGIEAYKLPIYSHVIYLHPKAGATDPGQYVQEIPGYNIFIQYRVLRLAKMDGQPLLDANRIGLVPFAILMKPPAQVDMPEWIRRCVRTVEASSQDESQKIESLADLAILGGLAHEYESIREIIMEEAVQESSTIQYFTEKGFEQGREEGVVQGREEGIQQGIQLGIQQAEKMSIRKVVLATLAAKFEPEM